MNTECIVRNAYYIISFNKISLDIYLISIKVCLIIINIIIILFVFLLNLSLNRKHSII